MGQGLEERGHLKAIQNEQWKQHGSGTISKHHQSQRPKSMRVGENDIQRIVETMENLSAALELSIVRTCQMYNVEDHTNTMYNVIRMNY